MAFSFKIISKYIYQGIISKELIIFAKTSHYERNLYP